MSYLLNVLYLIALVFYSPWLIYGAIWKNKYRQGWSEKLLGLVPRREGDRYCIWLHAVSVGEVNLLANLISRIEHRWPNVECVISSTTRTGFELATRKYAPRLVFYCPFDFSWSVGEAMRRIRPNLLILAELELWPNLLKAARSGGISTAIVNGRLSYRSARGYQWIRPLVGRTLRCVDLIAVQNSEYRRRFLTLGADPNTTIVTGSLKFDGAETNRDNVVTVGFRKLWRLAVGDQVFLAGSTQHPEENIVIDCFARLQSRFPQLKLVIVPRHPERFDEVGRLLDQSGLKWDRRSRLSSGAVTREPARVLLVDTVGELRGWWGTASVGFVGGSFGTRGGQSMIEPAAYGVACCYGPNTRNFREIVEILRTRDAAKELQTPADLESFVQSCLEDPVTASSMGQRARKLVIEQKGAVDRTIDLLNGCINGQSICRAA